MLTILILITITAVFLQLILTLIYYLYSLPRANKYNFLHISGVTIAKMLETYSRVYKQINIRVDANISESGYYSKKDQIILVNQQDAYLNHSRPAIDVLLEVVKFSHGSRSNLIYKFLRVSFIIQIGIILLSFLDIRLLYLAILITTLNLIISFVLESRLTVYLLQTLEIGIDLFDYDEVEVGMAQRIVTPLSGYAFTYPLTAITDLIGFLGFNYLRK